MKAGILWAALGLLATVQAATTTTESRSSSTRTAGAAGATHTVQVAPVGDEIYLKC